jgi:glycine/D-amino acid oxidase-like deaminating enzyme
MRSTCYWLDTASLRPPPQLSPESPLPSQTDVAVIGGGYTGVSAARTLARHGVDVTVLEAHTLGWGASTRNGGFVLPGFKIGAGDLLQKQGVVRARALFDAARDAVRLLEDLVASEAIDCEYTRCGYVALAYKPKHYGDLERSAALLSQTFAYETELVPRDRLRSEIASDAYYGGLLEPAGGIHPAKYFFGMAAAARRAGARLLEGVEVQRFRRTAGGGFDLTTSRGPIHAREILVATNGYSGDVAPRLRRGVVPIGSYIIATAPLDARVAAELIPRRRVMSDTKNLLFYFRLTADNRLLFGGRASFTPTNSITSARILARGMTQVFPQLTGVPVDYSWSGKVGYTFDQLPHAGTMDGVHYAMGYCGHGVALATYLGARVGDAIAGKGDLLPFSELRFPTMPFYRKRPWFLPLAGAWYRLADLVS